jgi:hypothetical protein
MSVAVSAALSIAVFVIVFVAVQGNRPHASCCAS